MTKIEQKEIEGTLYWVEEVTENKWCIKYWRTVEEAAAAAATLVNCDSCTDCTSCIDCVDCTDCAACHHCENCTNMVRCIGCSNCKSMSDCVNCLECVQCRGCVNLQEAKDKLCMSDQYPKYRCLRCEHYYKCSREREFLTSLGIDCPDYSWDPLA